MEREEEDVLVESATVRARSGHHDCRVLFVPDQNDDTQPFITDKRITAKNATAWVTHYAYRWWIEAEYRSIKQGFSRGHPRQIIPCDSTISCSAS